MRGWEKKSMEEKTLEIRKISEELEGVFRKAGYPVQEASTLAWDLAELVGACRTCSERILELRMNQNGDMRYFVVELTTLEAYLEDMKGHLNDSLKSLPE